MSRPTQGLSHHLASLRARLSLRLAQLRAFHFVSPHSGPFTSSRPTQGLLLPLAFHVVSLLGPFTLSRPSPGLTHHLGPLRPFTSSRSTQGLPLCLTPLRAFHFVSPHSGHFTSSRPPQGLLHHAAPLRAFHIMSPHSGPFTSYRPTQGLPHHVAPLRAFHIVSIFFICLLILFSSFFLGGGGVLLLITRLRAMDHVPIGSATQRSNNERLFNIGAAPPVSSTQWTGAAVEFECSEIRPDWHNQHAQSSWGRSQTARSARLKSPCVGLSFDAFSCMYALHYFFVSGQL